MQFLLLDIEKIYVGRKREEKESRRAERRKKNRKKIRLVLQLTNVFINCVIVIWVQRLKRISPDRSTAERKRHQKNLQDANRSYFVVDRIGLIDLFVDTAVCGDKHVALTSNSDINNKLECDEDDNISSKKIWLWR